MAQQQIPEYTPPSIEDIIKQVQQASTVQVPSPPSVHVPQITGKINVPPPPQFETPTLPEYVRPQFPQYQLESAPEAPFYQTPEALQEYLQKFLQLGYERATRGIELPEEYVTNLYRRAREQIAAEAQEALRKYQESLASRGLAQSGLAMRAEQQITEKALGAQSQAVRDIETELAARQMASMQEAYNQAIQVMQIYGNEAWKVYASEYNRWAQEVELLKQRNEIYFREALEKFGAEREAALAQYNAGVQAVLQAYQANITSTMAAYQAAVQQNNMVLQAQLQAQLNAQLQRYALQQAYYQAQTALAQMQQEQIYNLQQYYAQATDEWNQMVYQMQANAEAARQQALGDILGTFIGALLLFALL